ncbi:putative peroxisomal 2,4-dienoyl-CoA reductase SPS19 [Tothia fuscella]|uniref:2,4-dienoyl-CoA reductase [(3E)-enoyl-CoA-producing] n=1 Tax=Tothia fuscella TaxID=1048955 RepID=A0A9P4U0C5_9PEZI|nr:putative peroxisomal 2,4-dienoyl-CoA reductase SPS19 [Tothia fuscella]
MVLQRQEYLSDVWRDGIFENKVIFCTGGAGTICSAQVRALVHLGANACIIGRNVEKTEKMAKDIATARSGAKVIGIGAVDVRDPQSLQDAADRCAKELGGIDFVIAGAAGNFLAPISQLSANAFKSVIDIDVLGSYNTVKATLPYLQQSAKLYKTDGKIPPPKGTGGRIIFVSATMHYTGTAMQTHVSAAKAAVDTLAHSICIEQGPRGITANVISPGPIAGTEGMERLSASKESDGSATKHIPSGRWGTVKEIADATVYIFSDAGNYVNGEILVVDGGSWHTHFQPGSGNSKWAYPDFLLGDEEVTGVKGGKKSKL